MFERRDGGGGVVTRRLQHSTGMLRLGPFTVLTDPNFVHRGHWIDLGYGLPPLDAPH